MFLTSSLRICGEVELHVHQYLHRTGTSLEDIERVYTHPHVAGAVPWLAATAPAAAVQRSRWRATPKAARRARNDEGTAAIAGESAAAHLRPEDPGDRDRRPRRQHHALLCVGRKLFKPMVTTAPPPVLGATSPARCSSCCSRCAEHRHQHDRIESRPSHRKTWDYVFFLDIDGHADDVNVAKALAALKKRASLFRVLGSYPRAVS